MLLLVAAPLAMTSSGCATFDKKLGATGPSTSVPRECQRIAKKRIPRPTEDEGDDLADIAAGYKAAYEKAEKRNEKVIACEDRQGDEFAKGVR